MYPALASSRRARLGRWVVLLLCAAMLFSGGSSALAQDQTGSDDDRLDLLIALDVSGSMGRNIASNERALDFGTTRLFIQSAGNVSVTRTQASDPSNLRVETTEVLIEWLSDYVANRDQLDVNVMVMAFDDEVTTVFGWEALGRATAGTTLDVPSGDHSDFLALYRAADDAFSEVENGSRQAMIVVTDSTPCAPQRSTDGICGLDRDMVTQVNQLPPLTGVSQHMLYLNPTNLNFTEYWDNYGQGGDVRRQWQARLNDRFIELADGVEELPASMIHTVLTEIAAASGVIPPDEVGTGQRLTPSQYAALGLTYTTGGDFDVAPYQSYFDTLTVFDNPSETVQFTTPDGESEEGSALFQTTGNRLQAVRVSQPEPGEWDGPAETWIAFRPAEVRVRLSSPNPLQYTPLSFFYELVDASEGTLISPQTEAVPEIDVTVRMPDGSRLQLGTMSAEGDRFVSVPVLPLEPGSQYALSINVDAGSGALWNVVESTAYLEPNSLPDINVQAVSFDTDFVVRRPATGPDAAPPSRAGDRTITIPRSLPLAVTMTAEAGGQPIVLPEGISAELVFVPPDDEGDTTNACPSADPVPLDIEDEREQAVTEINFAVAGTCDLEVRVSLESSIAPLQGNQRVLDVPRMARSVTVTDTERLTFFLIDQAGTVIEEPNAAEIADDPHYAMNERQANPPSYTPNTMTLRVELRDEQGNPLTTWPNFLPGAQRADADVCTGPETPDAEATAEPGAPQIVPGQQRIVPFSLRILNDNEEDVAAQREICWYASDNPGVYLATFSGLPAGDYTVQAVLDRGAPPLDFEVFEYAPVLFENTADRITTRSLSMQIGTDPAIALQIVGAIGTVVLAFVTGAFVIVRRRADTVAPLRGGIAIARVDSNLVDIFKSADNDERLSEPVDFPWRREWPRQNRQVFKASDFIEVARLNIEMLEATTSREKVISQSGGFYVRMRLTNGGDPMGGKRLDSNQARLINRDQTGSYYLVNISPGRSMTVQELLQSAGE